MTITKYKNRSIDLNKPVELYRCLNRKGKVYSIRQHGLVVGHTQKILLKKCIMIVNKAGKKRSIKTNERNVHAFIKGYIGNSIDKKVDASSYVLKYDPFSVMNFYVHADNGPENIEKADVIYIDGESIYAQI